MWSDRLDRLPTYSVTPELRLAEASSVRARLVGLALLDALPLDRALLIPHCRSVHTFGMRFPIDVVFVDSVGRALRVERNLAPGRFAAARRARTVIETCAGEADRFLAAGAGDVAADVLSRRRRPVAAGGR